MIDVYYLLQIIIFLDYLNILFIIRLSADCLFINLRMYTIYSVLYIITSNYLSIYVMVDMHCLSTGSYFVSSLTDMLGVALRMTKSYRTICVVHCCFVVFKQYDNVLWWVCVFVFFLQKICDGLQNIRWWVDVSQNAITSIRV